MKYKHKITGEEATLLEDYYQVTGDVVPKRFIEDSCDWEKVIEKDYEIVSYTFEDILCTKRSNGKYLRVDCTDKGGVTLKEVLSFWRDGYAIHSVKRLSDGEVFTVGDKVGFKNHSDEEVIESIVIKRGNLWLNFSKDELCRLSGVKKLKQPLFTTEDNVEIYAGDVFYYIGDALNICETKCLFKGDGDFEKFKNFAKKENAEEYVKQNEKKYSLKDMVKLANHWAYIKSVTPENALKVMEKWENK